MMLFWNSEVKVKSGSCIVLQQATYIADNPLKSTLSGILHMTFSGLK